MAKEKLTYSEALKEIRRDGNKKTFEQAWKDLEKFHAKRHLYV